MRHLVKVNIIRRQYPIGSDGQRLDLGIDQFPVRPENVDSVTGFPMNDMAILLNASVSSDSSRYEAVALRLRALTPQTKGKSIEELWKDWRPAWVQSPAEIKQFVSWYNQTYPDEQIKYDSTESGPSASSDASASSDTSSSES